MTSTITTPLAKPKRRVKYLTKLSEVPQLTNSERATLAPVAERFAFRANEYYLNLIDWDNPDDPIRKLVVPREHELTSAGEWDASNENAITVQRGVQHKYGTTVLLLVNEVCDAYCRYCFRKRLFTNENDEASNDVSAGLAYIRRHPEVDNVLLTGGDPLLLSTRRLRSTVDALREIDHVKIIRIGSKTPAFNPMRISGDEQLLDMFRTHSHADRRMYLICHFDHPVELTRESLKALEKVQEAGVICVNQCPIIRGISDDPQVLSELWNRLSYIGVPQYYIFQCRPTAGNDPFELPIAEAYTKVEEAKRNCSGLAKRIKYVMSHASGKVEVVGMDDRHFYMKYHRAKNIEDEQRFFVCRRDDQAKWLDDLEVVDGFVNN